MSTPLPLDVLRVSCSRCLAPPGELCQSIRPAVWMNGHHERRRLLNRIRNRPPVEVRDPRGPAPAGAS